MIAALALIVSIAPWNGGDLPTATSAAAKYRLTVAGTAQSVAHLRTAGVAPGWIAAFCNARICSPNAIDVTLPASGRTTLQFELIREDERAPRASGATILGGSKPVRVAPEGRVRP